MKKTAQRKHKTKNLKPKKNFNWKNLFQFFLMVPVLLLLLAPGSWFLVQKADAATGLNRVINFQGRVVNKADGTNVTDGNYSFTFKLYDSASSGNLLWQETQSSISVTNGIFQVSLGSATAFNAGGFNVDFKQNNLYLDITFNSENFGSRVQLAAVPQAIDAEQLSGVVATQSANGFTMTGGLSTSKTLTVNNTLALSAGSDGLTFTVPTPGSGTTTTALTNNASSQTITSVQTTGTVLALSDSAALTGALTGTSITLSGSNSQNETGLTFSVSNAGGTLTDILGTSSNWKVLSSGVATFISGTQVTNAGPSFFQIADTAGAQGSYRLYTGLQAGVVDDFGITDGSAQSKIYLAGVNQAGIYKDGIGLGPGFMTPKGVVHISGGQRGGNAALIVDQTGASINDIFTASASGTTKFTIGNTGNITDTSATTVNFSGAALTVASCTGCGGGAGGLVQVPTSNTPGAASANVIQPTAPSITGLTVNSTSNATGAIALIVNQTIGGNDGADINLTNATGTNTNGLSVTQSGGGTTTNGINITNTGSTISTGLKLTGTFTTLISASNFSVSNGGVISVVGGTAGDLTTLSSAGGTSLTIVPSVPSATNNGVGLTLKSSNGTTTGTGGPIQITAGNGVGSGTQTGGTIALLTGNGAGTGLSGGLTLNTGTSASGVNTGAITVQSGNITTSGTSGNVSLEVGTGGTLGTIQIGNATAAPINIGTASTAKAIAIGSTTAGAGDTITIGNSQNAGSVSVGGTMTTGTISLGNSSQTGAITLTSGVTTSGTGISLSANGAITSAASSGLLLSATGVTSGTGLQITGGSNLINGGKLINVSGASYNLANASDNGSVDNISFSNISSNTSGTTTVSGITFTPTYNVTGAGTHTLADINLAGVVTNTCGAGTCNKYGLYFSGTGYTQEISLQNSQTIDNATSGQIRINNTAPTASATVANVLIGPTALGSTGNVNGTFLGLDAATSFAGDLINFQQNNVNLFRINSVASAVNGFKFSPKATGTAPIISASSDTGSDTNLGLTINSAGTGTLLLDSAAAAGTVSIGPTNATTINVGNGTGANVIHIGDGATLTGNTETIHIGDGTPAGTALTNIIIGNAINGGALTLKSGSGNITIGSNAGLGNVVIAPNAGGVAALIVNKQNSVGDVFTASASGQTLFRITNNGSFMFQGSILVATGSGGVGNGSNAAVNALGDEGSLIPNAGFESALVNAWGDGWFPAATTSAGLFTRDTATPAKGTGSLSVTISNTTAAIYSACIPVAGGTNLGSYTLNYYAKSSSATKMNITSFIDGYTSKANCQGDTSPTLSMVKSATIGTSWVLSGSGATAVTSFGASATWARVHFLFTATGNGLTGEVDGVRFIEKDGGQGLDYAENYPANPQNIPQPGDIVSIDLSPNASLAQVVPAYKDMDSNMLGVVSTNPGQILDDGSMPGPKVPIALAGRVPIKVSTQNGPIAIGDYLTSSTMPGVAVKAISPGSIVGIAMQSYSGDGIGSITVFINKGYFAGINNAGLAGQGVGLTSLIGNKSTGINLQVENNKLVIKATDGSNAITFDQNGNATFAGVLTAKEIRADHISGLDALNAEIASLSAQIGSTSGVLGAEIAASTSGVTNNDVSLASLSVDGLATISGNLRAKSNALFEGLVSIVDTLTVHNVLVTGTTDFLGSVVFHDHVQVAPDTAGKVVIKKDTNTITVHFAKSYTNTPIVSTSIALDQKTNPDGSVIDQESLQQALLSGGYSYIITNKSTQGFSITLNKLATDDMPFNWTAVEGSQ